MSASTADRSTTPAVWDVVRWALLGYGYLSALLLLILAGLIVLQQGGGWAALWSLPGITLAVFGYVLLRALWLTLPPPEGVVLAPAEAPGLFAALERLAGRLDAPVPDEVRIGDDLNAAVTERALIPLVGRRRRILRIGLPLLESMPAAEFEAILAHELAHLSRQHHQITLQVARLYNALTALAYGLQVGGHWGAFFLLPFYRWYLPRFESRFLVVSREHEFESDALAARATSAETAGRALFRLGILAGYLEPRAWPAVRQAAAVSPTPPADLLARLGATLRDGPSAGAAGVLATRALQDRTLSGHTHPSLADRLRGLGVATDSMAATAASLFPAASRVALDTLIAPDRIESLRSEVTGAWIRAHAESWQRWHQWSARWEEASARSEREGGEPPAEAWAARGRWAQACLVPEDAAPVLDEAVRRNPDDLQLQLLYGVTLLQLEDAGRCAAGQALLERLAERETLLALPAVELLEARAAEAGDDLAVAQYRDRKAALRAGHIAAAREALTVDASATVETVALPEPEFRDLQRAVEAEPAIHTAYLVRRVTRHYADEVVYLLLIQADVRWYQSERGGAAAAAVARLVASAPFPAGSRGVIAVLERHSRLRRRLRRLPGALLYRRGERVAPARAVLLSRPLIARLAPFWLEARFYVAPVLVLLLSLGLGWMTRREHRPVSRGMLPRTLPELRREVAESPDAAGPRAALADRYYDLDRMASAESSYAIAVRLDSTNVNTWRRLGWVRYKLGRAGEALAPLERATSLDAGDYYARYDLGLTQMALGQWREADESFRLAGAIDSTSGYPAMQRARTLTALRRYDEGREQARIAERLRPEDYDVWGVAASLEVESQHAADAYAPAHRAVELAGDNPRVLAFFGRVAYLNSRYDESVTAYRRALALDSAIVRQNPYDQQVLASIERETGQKP